MSRNPKDPVYRAAEAMSLPSEVLGASQIEITGCRQVLLCGHKGIRLYSPENIIVELADCAVEVTGQALGILTMTRQELLLQGTVDGVRFLR